MGRKIYYHTQILHEEYNRFTGQLRGYYEVLIISDQVSKNQIRNLITKCTDILDWYNQRVNIGLLMEEESLRSFNSLLNDEISNYQFYEEWSAQIIGYS